MAGAGGGFVAWLLICQIALSIILAAIFLFRPSLTTGTAWKAELEFIESEFEPWECKGFCRFPVA